MNFCKWIRVPSLLVFKQKFIDQVQKWTTFASQKKKKNHWKIDNL
jgi:hypothetical protein